jgi:hypothetical protein
MDIISTKCCGVNEIHGLKEYPNDPEKAMLDFCENQLESNNKFHRETASVKNAICTHYFFTGAVYDRDLTADGGVKDEHYGRAFANFIKKNKFGVVMESPCEINKAWHPDHSTVMWMWTPNFNNLRAWYVKLRGDRMIKRLKDSIPEAEGRIARCSQALKNMGSTHYLRSVYETNLKNAEKDLAEAKKALAIAEKQKEAA